MLKSILVDKLNLSKYTIKFSEVVHFYYSYRNLICNFWKLTPSQVNFDYFD